MKTLPRSEVPLFAALVAISLAATVADAANPAGAVQELKEGYALKQSGNCRDASLHFTRSLELEPTAKAYLNLADCDQRLGDLVAARGHADRGGALAVQRGDAELARVAQEQIGAVERRLARITITLPPGAPAGTAVSCDGKPVEGSSLGVPVAMNPGDHVVVTTAPGRAERKVSLAFAEGSFQAIEVSLGEAAASHRGEAQAAGHDSDSASPPQGLGPRRAVALGVGGLGATGLALGLIAGLMATSNHSTLESKCQPSTGACPPSAQSDLDAFHTMKTWSTAGYVVGLAALAGGAVLWLTAPPRQGSPIARVWFGPGAAGVAGQF